MKKVLLALLALFALSVTPVVFAEDLPEVPADDSMEELPPLVDAGDVS